MCICIPHAYIAHGGQKRVLGPLELKLELIVSYLVGAGNYLSQLLCENKKGF